MAAASTREFCLRWNNHEPNLATYFSSLYASETFVDVTLVSSEGKKIVAHKLVLSACSPYFQIAFENNPCKHPVVILKDVQFSDLQAIVKFMYNGEVNISEERINPILRTATSLQVKGLMEVPAEELKRVSTSGAGASIDHPPPRTYSHPPPPLSSSLSWDPGDGSSEIPRKKLKKSASATATAAPYSTNSPKTNGESVDSGVGTSVSKSLDEGGRGGSRSSSSSSPPLGGEDHPATATATATLQKRAPSIIPPPPPLLPKSKSLDHNMQGGREAPEDHDMAMAASLSDQHQSYDDSSLGMERGYDLEIEEAEDCEEEEEVRLGEEEDLVEYYEEEEEEDEEYYDESYGYIPLSYATQMMGGRGGGKPAPPPPMMPALTPVVLNASTAHNNNNNTSSSSSSSTINARIREALHSSNARFSNGPVFRRRSERQEIDPERLEQAMEFLRNGATYREAAAKFGTALGERRRRGRPLLRQPRIKRSDNEAGGAREFIGYEGVEGGGGGGIIERTNSDGGSEEPDTSEGRRGGRRRRASISLPTTIEATSPQCSKIHQSNLPIVRVSQSSPTPPSTPPHHDYPPSPPPPIKEEQIPVIVPNISLSSSSNANAPELSSTPTHTLLKVPCSDSFPPTSGSGSGSGSIGNQLVKQISQPSLPSHSLIQIGGGSGHGSLVIRRQNSTPASTRIVQSPSSSSSSSFTTIRQGSLFQIFPTDHPDDNGSKTILLDWPAEQLQRPELKVGGEQQQQQEESEELLGCPKTSTVSVGSFDEGGLPLNRAGHCPALRPGPALGCNFCWNSVDSCGRILRRKTKYHCPECHINLCIVPCFQEYHEKADKKKRPRSKLGLPKPNSM